MRAAAMRSMFRPGRFAVDAAMGTVIGCAAAESLRQMGSLGERVPAVRVFGEMPQGLVLLAPMVVGWQLAHVFRELARHRFAVLLPGFRQRMLAWHSASIALLAAALVGLQRAVGLRLPVAAALAVAGLGLSVAVPFSPRTTWRRAAAYVALNAALFMGGGIACVELAGAIGRMPSVFALAGFAGAVACLAKGYSRRALRIRAAGASPAAVSKPWTPPGIPPRARVLFLGAACGVGLFLGWTSDFGVGRLGPGPAGGIAVDYGPILGVLVVVAVMANPGLLLLRNDRSPISRPRRLERSRSSYFWLWLCALMSAVGAAAGFTLRVHGAAGNWLQIATVQTAVLFAVAVVAYPFSIALGLKFERKRSAGGLGLDVLLLRMIPTVAVMLPLSAMGRSILPQPSFIIGVIGVGLVCHLWCQASLRDYFLRADLVTSQG
jgi:hypothetical protein